MNKRWMRILSVALSLACAFGTVGTVTPASKVEAAKKTYVVVLDPGHDKTHTGARRSGLTEEEVTIKLAKYVKRALIDDYDNVKVYLTRTGEDCAFGGSSISTRECLEKRPKYAKQKKADVFVSLHLNTTTSTVPQGVETWYPSLYSKKKVGKDSYALAQKIQARLAKLGLTNRGLKPTTGLIVLKRANEYGIPAALVEHGFMSNAVDRSWQTSTAKLKKMAQADADGIAESLGLKKTDDVDDDEEDEDYDEDDEDYDDDDDDDDYDSVKVTTTQNPSTVTKAVKTTGKKTVATKVQLKSISAAGFTGLQISWDAFPNARGYSIYRRARGGYDYDSSFEKVDTTKELSYTDYDVQPATTYQYTVRAYGKGFKTGNTKKFLTKKTRANGVEEFQAVRGTFNVINLSWKQKSDANGYRIERAKVDEDDGTTGKFTRLTAFTKPTILAYQDATTESGATYKYRIRAFHNNGSTKEWGVYKTIKITAGSSKVKTLTVKRESDTQVKLTWSAVSKAAGYEVSRSKNSGSFTVLDTIDNGSRTYTDEKADSSSSYKYRVRAFYVENAQTYWGGYSDTVSLSDASKTSSSDASFLIAGKPQTTKTQMVKYYKARGVSYPSSVYSKKGADDIEEFVAIVYKEAVDEGIRPEVVFGQICRETRFLQFGGQVKASQCNFAGLGVTGEDTSGESFSSVEKGVRAQVQHLKAYANTESLVHSKVDPRFDFVKRGSAKYVEWLGIQENPNNSGWASEKNYGYSLIENFIEVLLET